jgi:hypothetical protein
MNPADLYVQSNELANQKERILKWLNNESEAIVLIDGLKRPALSGSFPLKVILPLGLACGLFLGFVMCVLAAITKEVQGRLSTVK